MVLMELSIVNQILLVGISALLAAMFSSAGAVWVSRNADRRKDNAVRNRAISMLRQVEWITHNFKRVTYVEQAQLMPIEALYKLLNKEDLTLEMAFNSYELGTLLTISTVLHIFLETAKPYFRAQTDKERDDAFHELQRVNDALNDGTSSLLTDALKEGLLSRSSFELKR